MAGGRITSQEVARLAGVSQSAVSRVFTPGASASPKTVEKVRDAAEQLGYRPNALARSLITGKSRIIGVVVAYLNNQFYPEALERLSIALQERGYHVLVFTATNTIENADRVIRDILDYQVDGIILASVALSSHLADQAEAVGVPVVLFNRSQDGDEVMAVTSANRAGGALAAEHLLAKGCERIAHISGWMGSSTGRDRSTGFRQALERAGHEPVAEIDGFYDRDIAGKAALQILDKTDADAIFVGNDHMAFAVMDALRSANYAIPDNVAIIGYDDVPIAAWAAYDLTTVRQPVNQMVEAVVDMLFRRLEGQDTKPCTLEIPGPLIERGSTKINKGRKT